MTPASTTPDLRGEVAIVTGAALNTGSLIAKTLAAAGAAVAVNYRSSAEGAQATVNAIEKAGGRAFAVKADVTRQDDVARMVAATVDRLGPPTILINNANVRSFRKLMDITPEEWRATLAPTLDGTLYCVQACVPHMRSARHGTIINIGGGSGHSGRPNRAHVAAAKAGLAGMTGSMAVELAPDNITVNCVVPGRVNTPRPTEDPLNPKKHKAPMGRDCDQQELANLILFLSGPGCRYMTGNMLHVNGGEYVTIA
jgi:3-oxoacyl-[acyl-carrier protein] reductase